MTTAEKIENVILYGNVQGKPSLKGKKWLSKSEAGLDFLDHDCHASPEDGCAHESHQQI